MALMTMVRPGLYIGTLDAALDGTLLREHGISSLLSLCPDDLLTSLPTCIARQRSIPILDTEESDLLSWLPSCLEFIQRCLAERQEAEEADEPVQSLLVHCHAGISRSCAVVMAHLMSTENLVPAEAFRTIKKLHRIARPNEGFVEQLKLFAKMGNRVDANHPEFRIYRFNHMADQRAQEGRVEPAAFAADPGLGPTPKDCTVTVRCRRCRRLLLTDTNLLDHEPGDGQLSFSYRKRTSSAVRECSSIFTEPSTWMKEVADGLVEGKLLCPKCSGRVGSFHWAGAQCSCGAWVTPAIRIHKSSVDIDDSSFRAPITISSLVRPAAESIAESVADTDADSDAALQGGDSLSYEANGSATPQTVDKAEAK